MGNQWTLQDAKNSFSAVVAAAQKGELQHVTKRGIEAVVVLSAEDYARLAAQELEAKPTRNFVEHLLNAPKLPEGFDELLDKKTPVILEMNEIDFDE